jgi:hypothetical protein
MKLNKYYMSSTKTCSFKIIKQNDWCAVRLYPYHFRHFVDVFGQKRWPNNAATPAGYNKTRSQATCRQISMSSKVQTREASVLAIPNHAPEKRSE